MNAPLPAKAVEAPNRDDMSDVSSRRREAAAKHLRQALAELRGAKTSIGKSRGWLPLCPTELELQLIPPKIYDVEKALLRLARRLEASL